MDHYMTAARLKMKRTTPQILKFISGSKMSLHAENWSYMPLWRLDQAFQDLRTHGIQIRFITNLDMDGQFALL